MAKKKKKDRKRKSSGATVNISVLDFVDRIKRKVYNRMPSFYFDCDNCKNNCCLSPYISVMEFFVVVKYVIRIYGENAHNVLLNDNGEDKDGVKKCPFLDPVDKRCKVYDSRYFKCRLQGFDIVDKMFKIGCDHKKEANLKPPPITREQWLGWIAVLNKINKKFPFNEQLNTQEWIDLYFSGDDKLDSKKIITRNFLKIHLQLEKVIPQVGNDILEDSV